MENEEQKKIRRKASEKKAMEGEEQKMKQTNSK